MLLLCFFCYTGVDYSFAHSSLNLTFHGNGPVSRQLQLDVTNDMLVEGHEVAYLSLTQPMFTNIESNGAILGTNSSARIVIVDDDGRATPSFFFSSYLPHSSPFPPAH